MIFIAHRGNMDGPNKEIENNPMLLEAALENGFDVEVDVRLINSDWMLGHDEPRYNIDKRFLLNQHVWCHAKDIRTLHVLLKLGAHCFFHVGDDATLTSKGFIWTYPEKYLTNKSICVQPTFHRDGCPVEKNLFDAYGICSDYIKSIRDIYNG